MRGKIIVLLFAFVWGLGACSNEEPIGPSSGHDGKDVTLAVSLISADAIQTKADPLITDQEKTINTTLVMVFKKKSTDGIKETYVCNGWATGVGNGAVSVKTKAGDAKIIAVANIDERLLISLKPKYEAGTLTDDEMATEYTEQQLTDPANLIKVGEMEVKLAATNENEPEIIAIELIHLPARIDVEIKTVDASGETWTFEPTTYNVANIRSASDLILFGGGRSTNDKTMVTTPYDKDATNGISFYTYEKDTNTEPVIVEISGTLTNTTKGTPAETKTYRLPINPVADGKDSKTTGIIHGYAYLVTGTIDAKKPGITIDIQVVPMQKLPVDVGYGEGEKWD